jgi:hypothetical protein
VFIPSSLCLSANFELLFIICSVSANLESFSSKSRPPHDTGPTELAQMASTGYSHPSYAYGKGPKDSYAVQYNIAETRAVVTDEQSDKDRDEQSRDNCMVSFGRGTSNISHISGVSLSSSNLTYASTPCPTTPTGNLHFGGYGTITKTEYSSSSLTPSPWDSQLPTFDQPDSMRWTPNTLGWMPNSELLNLYKFVVRNSKEPYFQLMDRWTPTQQTPAKVYLDNPE